MLRKLKHILKVLSSGSAGRSSVLVSVAQNIMMRIFGRPIGVLGKVGGHHGPQQSEDGGLGHRPARIHANDRVNGSVEHERG